MFYGQSVASSLWMIVIFMRRSFLSRIIVEDRGRNFYLDRPMHRSDLFVKLFCEFELIVLCGPHMNSDNFI